MQKILLTSAAAFVFAIAASSVSVPEAEAQSGSRLCGIANGPVAMLVELKQPKSKKGRKKVNKACKNLAAEFRQGLTDGGVPNAASWKYYERAECEGVAKEMSGGRSSADICEGFKDQNGNAAMEREKAYKVTYKGGNNFDFERLN